MKRIVVRIREEDKELTLKKHYNEVIALLQNIALKIDAYIDFCFGGDAVEDKQMRESEGDGEKILETIQHFFNSLKRKLMSWYNITPGIRTQRDYIAINDNTAMIDSHSRNIYNIRINLQVANTPIYRQTDKNEKEKIKDLCDNYFDNLLELKDLMEPYIKENNRIHKVWHFKALDNRKSRANILKWVNELLNNLGKSQLKEDQLKRGDSTIRIGLKVIFGRDEKYWTGKITDIYTMNRKEFYEVLDAVADDGGVKSFSYLRNKDISQIVREE